MKNVYHHHIHCVKITGFKAERGRERLFQPDTPDDEWMDFVGSRNWVVISQDYSFHRERAVLSVIRQHRVKVFYMWGASERKQEVMRVLLNNFSRIIETARNPGPYVFRVKQRGPLTRFM